MLIIAKMANDRKKKEEGEDRLAYSSGESIYEDNQAEFQSLKPAERDEHLKELWRTCFLKSVGSAQIKRVFLKLHERVINYGTTKNINTMSASDIEKKILESKPDIVLLQDNPFKKAWDVLMIFMLLYVIIWVPYAIVFVQSDGSFGVA